MARRLLSPRAMSHQPYVVRRLRTTFANFVSGDEEFVPEVVAEEVRLSAEEVELRLSERWLRSTDLVLILGTWTTLADSLPFAEIARPFARRERVLLMVQDAMLPALLFGALLIAFYLELRFPLSR
jgi:hypothetical protein